MREHPGAWPEPFGGPDVADGTPALAGLSPSSAVEAVAAQLVIDGAVTEQSFQRLAELMGRFAGFVSVGHGLVDLGGTTKAMVDEFIDAPTRDGAPPSATVRHLRRCAVRLLFKTARQLGLVDGDPTLDLDLPARRPPSARPLSDAEVDWCRAASLYLFAGTRLPAAWALAEAGIRTGEMAKVTVGDVDLELGVVHAPGCRSAVARSVLLTEWGAAQIGRRLRAVPADPARPLVYEGDGSDKSKQASSCIAITDSMTRAGLSHDPAVRPVSATAWAGRKVFDETGRIDQVAARLGMRSLDRAARLIGLDHRPGDDG